MTTRPTRRIDSTSLQFKKRTPRVLLAAMKGARITLQLPDESGGKSLVVAKVGDVIKVSLRTREPSLAKLRCAAVAAQIERMTLTVSNAPQSLSQREVVALAGEVYREAVDIWGDNPGSSILWRLRQLGAERADAACVEKILRPAADELLLEQGLSVDDATRDRLALAIRDALRASAATLVKHAENDFSPDTNAAKFPPWNGAAEPVTISGLLEGWQAEAQRLDKSPSTIEGYSRTVRQFIAFLRHDDATRVTQEDVLRYKHKRLVEDMRSPKTVLGADLAALKAVFGWAVANRRLKSNPASDVTLKLPKKRKGDGYSDAGAAKLLQAALSYTRAEGEAEQMAAAKKWSPWLAAFTGARVGEIVQLRREDVYKKDGVWLVHITPDAGRVKDREVREVPLHPQLIELGFIDFAQSAPKTYLFLSGSDKHDTADQRQTTINRLGEFARDLVREDRVAANHGWRHRFIKLCRRNGVDVELRRKITGHAGHGVDEEDYGGPAEMQALYREVCKLPAYPAKRRH